jgi:hypothetical protein
MQLSAETRLFWKHRAPDGFEAWFRDKARHGLDAGGGGERTDKYVHDASQVELGIKQRDAKPGASSGYEVKSLVAASWSVLTSGPLAGRVELWTKVSAKTLVIDEKMLVPISKVRWLRKFDTAGVDPVEIPLNDREQPIDERRRGAGLPTLGCHVELTQVTNGTGDVWWTFGLEAFGDIKTVEDDLVATAGLMVARGLPSLANSVALNYPAWLRDYAR